MSNALSKKPFMILDMWLPVIVMEQKDTIEKY